MKTKKYKKIVEENGYRYYENNYSITARKYSEEDYDIEIKVGKLRPGRLEVNIKGFCGDESDIILEAMELAETPLEDREEEEKDKENRPKFRVWDKGINNLDYDVRVTSTDKYEKVEVLDCFTDWREIEEPKYILMRGISLKDENGIEIYEGDLVEYRDGEESFKGEVVISCFGSCVKTENDYIRFEDFSDENTKMAGNCYVVGNIYEDSELL